MKPFVQLAFAAASLCTVGCVAPNYLIDGPPGPAREASIAIHEATLRREFAPFQNSAEAPARSIVVFLKCDLDSTDRATLMEKVSDLPVEFRPAEEEDDRALRGDQWGRSLSIRIKWIDYYSADVGVWRRDLNGGGGGTHVDARYESGQWRFYDTGRSSTIN